MFKKLDPLLHSQLRLTVMSFLLSCQETDFNELKGITDASSGNLSIQIKKLEKGKYVLVKKGFRNNYQHTSVEITKKGIGALEEYANDLKDYFKNLPK